MPYVLNTYEGYKTEYSYIGNVVSRITHKSISGGIETIDDTNDITFNISNNISQVIRTSFYLGNTSISKDTYLYDTKNTPNTNFNKYLKQINGIYGLNMNNKISNNNYSPSTNSTPTNQYTYQITYNSNQYPTRIIQTKVSDGSIVSDTTIEYY